MSSKTNIIILFQPNFTPYFCDIFSFVFFYLSLFCCYLVTQKKQITNQVTKVTK